jgi:DNA-binding NarL/FixJ family response regulator
LPRRRTRAGDSDDDNVDSLPMRTHLAPRPDVDLALAPGRRSGVHAALDSLPDLSPIDMSLLDTCRLDTLREFAARPELRNVPSIAVFGQRDTQRHRRVVGGGNRRLPSQAAVGVAVVGHASVAAARGQSTLDQSVHRLEAVLLEDGQRLG